MDVVVVEEKEKIVCLKFRACEGVKGLATMEVKTVTCKRSQLQKSCKETH